MTVQEIERLQSELSPKEDLTPYEGRWVALRHGRVIAVANNPEALRDDPDIQNDDGILLVGDPAGRYFL